METQNNNFLQTEFKTQQEKKQRDLMKSKSFVFDNAKCETFFVEEKQRWMPSSKVINRRESVKNLFKSIRKDALLYFELNNIVWWKQYEDLYFPNGNTLSSQIHCLNHLFAIRADHDAVLKVIQTILPDVAEIEASPIDEKFCVMDKYPYKTPSYISFEFTYKNKELLRERCNQRGANCTSVDAFVYAVNKEKKHILIAIEWKYTEAYEKTDDNKADYATVENRYRELAENSSILGDWKDLYNWDPQYELARQTLLMEQIIDNKPFDADDYRHIVVCPNDNTEMLADAVAFKDSLEDKSKFRIIDPQELLSPLQGNDDYKELLNYLETRYWNS